MLVKRIIRWFIPSKEAIEGLLTLDGSADYVDCVTGDSILNYFVTLSSSTSRVNSEKK